MKKWAAFVIICFSVNSFPQLPVSPRFSELKGMEDQQGNTHLFYRIYSVEPVFLGAITDNSAYHFDLSNNSDTLYFRDRIIKSVSQSAIIVGDYDHWNNDPSMFIYGGAFIFEYVPQPKIYRFNGWGNLISVGCLGVVNKIKISYNDDSLIYAGIRDDFCSIRSTDGGWNWEEFSNDYVFQSMFPDQDSILFAISKTTRTLYKTTNSGLTYYEVDTSAAYPETYFNYDSDGQHIYRISSSAFFNQYVLRVSDDKGEPLTWQTKYVSNSDIFISNDTFTSGVLYLANRRNLYLSTNFGDSFNLLKTFDKNIVGIYKKPDSNLLYAATKNKIYEITPDTNRVIKQLYSSNDLRWYPLSIGNKWIYELYGQNFNLPSNKKFVGLEVMEVIGDTALNNQLTYLKLTNEPSYWYKDTTYVRPDSLERILGIFNPVENKEILYEDFMAEKNDTVWIDSSDFKVLAYEQEFYIWGLSTYKRDIDYPTKFQSYELVKDIGLFYWRISDSLAQYTRILKGCIIDGVAYGDTVVSVKNEDTLVRSFKLKQNYPNPFNPTTNIKYQIPELSFVTIKVYDVLGNEIATLVNEELFAGEYEKEFDATGLTNGIYFYQLQAGDFIQTKKMVLLK